MNSSELHEAFRSGLGSEMSSRFSDRDVWRFANEAYRSFVRLIGGIADFTSAITQVAITAGVPISTLDPLILRVARITRASDNHEIKILNYTDVGTQVVQDYGRTSPLVMDDKQGEVRYGVMGMEKNKIRWISVPATNDTAKLLVYRLPVTVISRHGQDISEVEELHHMALLQRMNALAFAAPLVGDGAKAAGYQSGFEAYCAKVRSEMDRYKTKERTVRYGGL